MKILLHTCCGPCSIYPLRMLKGEGAFVMALWDNPNIHPYTEWKKRLDALKSHLLDEEIKLLPPVEYALKPWLRQMVYRESDRCRLCYHMRLTSAAKMAKRGKFEAFTTTLLYSKFQKHEVIKEVGEEVARSEGIDFYYRDYREGWKEGVERSKEKGMYRQQYCGCIYSEEERYAPKENKA
jgi:predicted adenine nucleotide alpha hydrolase (AANH) superfamily ATPase